MGKSIYLKLILILPLPILIFLKVPIEQTIEVKYYAIMKGVALLMFVGGLAKTSQAHLFFGLALSIWMGITIILEKNESYFLGEKVGKRYLGNNEKYSKLKVYRDGKCSIATGGLLGIDSILYLDYKLDGQTIWLFTEKPLNEFDAELVKVGERTYQIQRKMPLRRKDDD